MTSPLFERQATGGVVARDGLEFQDAYLLENIPFFLSQGAFSHAVSEVLGDIEVRYHRPGGGTACVLYEAKRNKLTKNQLWAEVAHFIELHRKASDEYVRFVLVCGDFNDEFEPMLRELERYRGPAASLNADSSIRASAEADIEARIVGMGQPAAVARFVLERVSFVEYNDANVSGAFGASLTKHSPSMANVRIGDVAQFQARCKELVARSIKGHISRHTLEAALTDSAPDVAKAWLATGTKLQLLAEPPSSFEELALDVSSFNGPERKLLSHVEWARLQQQLTEIGEFLKCSRDRRGVALSAKQRMSLACTIGFNLSATRGHVLQMEHNGQVFDTSNHGRANAKFFGEMQEHGTQAGADGVAYIAFPYPGRDDVVAEAEAIGLASAPWLELTSSLPLTSMADLNTTVHEAKAALSAFRSRYQLQRIHLYVKAPSVFAMALGHRLNGVGHIQLYDWDQGRYLPTVELA